MSQTVTIQQVADWARTNPSVVPVLGVGGLSAQPALGFAQSVAAMIFNTSLPWKWNRGFVPAFTGNVWQQDYATSITNLAWLEKAEYADLGQAGNEPAPIAPIEAVKELSRTTMRGVPTMICALPNSEAQCGTWAANTTYVSNAGTQHMGAKQAIPQVRDNNGNVQIVTTFGTSGATEPVWSTVIGGTTTDGTVTWTMLDPTAICLRLNALPVPGANTLQFGATYQLKMPIYTALTSLIGVPDELAPSWREIFLGYCMRHAGDPRWIQQLQAAQQTLVEALGAADREPDAYGFVPATSLMY